MKKRRKFFKFFACFSNETNEDDGDLFSVPGHAKPVSADDLNSTFRVSHFIQREDNRSRIYSSTPCFATNGVSGPNPASNSTAELRSVNAAASESLVVSQGLTSSYDPLLEVIENYFVC